MDPAQQIELEALNYQKPMNAVIDRGDSPVQQYYKDTTIFITGGSGFIGKQLIEKLLRSCAIKKIYLLTRSKKGRTISARLENMLKDPLYDKLREKQPKFADLIVPVEGDVADLKLGLDKGDWNKLAAEVNIIFHVAATVRFDEPLRLATLTNLRGTREVLALAKDCSNFKKFVHVSTAFTHATKNRIDTDVFEEFYPSPVPPEAMIQLAENVDEKRLDGITANLIDGWPNTYTFTKALAEEFLKTSAGDTPVCIVRPSIVLPAYYEPGPGWLDVTTLVGPSGIYLGSGIGIIHVVNADPDSCLPMAPVDYVNNAIIAAAWDSSNNSNTANSHIPIYTVRKNLRLGNIHDISVKEKSRLSTPMAVYYSNEIQIKEKYVYLLLALFLHYIPAYIVDFACWIIGKKPPQITSFVDIYKKIDKLFHVYDYFVHNEWNFKDNNLLKMVDGMNNADKAIFNCDVRTLDLQEYILIWGIGLRKYILKDGLTGTAKAYRKDQIFYFINCFILALYGYVLYYIAGIIVLLVKNIISSI